MTGVRAWCEGGPWHGYTCLVPADVTILSFGPARPMVQAAFLDEGRPVTIPAPAGRMSYRLAGVRADGVHVFAYAPGHVDPELDATAATFREGTRGCCPVCYSTSLAEQDGIVHCTACPWDETLLAD